jgi:DNA-binding transcriptional MocR family regulator
MSQKSLSNHDVYDFADELELSSNSIVEAVQELQARNLIRKAGGGKAENYEYKTNDRWILTNQGHQMRIRNAREKAQDSISLRNVK